MKVLIIVSFYFQLTLWKTPIEINLIYLGNGAWGGVVVKALRYQS